MPPREIEVRNEFADVVVKLDARANGARLAITDKRTGITNYLDALVLESLAWARHEDLYAIVDPAAQWPSDADADADADAKDASSA
ncbi:MAG: hypothetical protein ACRDT8_06185 [Micromonosporaceae bacterium]